LKLLWQHITHHRRVQLGMLFILLVIASFSEIFTIGAVLPFLGVIADPEQVFNNTELKPFIQLLGLTEAGQLLFPVTILFIVAALFSGVMRLLIQQDIDKIAKQTTVIVIAHRLSTIANADYVYALRRGRVVEEGAYSDLVAKNGYFNRMVELQTMKQPNPSENNNILS